jgi:hypothetical protein
MTHMQDIKAPVGENNLMVLGPMGRDNRQELGEVEDFLLRHDLQNSKKGSAVADRPT